MIKIVTVYDNNTVTIFIIYRHYFAAGNLQLKFPAIPLLFRIGTSQYLHLLY